MKFGRSGGAAGARQRGLITANSATGTRTRVARVRAEYPNQLDYSGSAPDKSGWNTRVVEELSFSFGPPGPSALAPPFAIFRQRGLVVLQRVEKFT